MTTAPRSPLVRFGVFEADVRNRELRKSGLKVKLQQQPFEVLETLLEQPGETVTREELRQRIWPADTFVDFDVGLNTAISRLRDALGDTAENPRFVETMPRRGYRFIAPVEVINGVAATVPFAPSTSEAARPVNENGLRPSEAEGDQATKNPGRVRWLMVGVAVSVALAIGLTTIGWLNPLSRSAGAGRVQSLAVLPLENLSHDPEQEYFADGMTDQLTTELSKIEALRVISRTSVMPYKGVRKPLATIATELNVEAVVEGTVLRAGNRVRITAQLIHGGTESHLWANSYEGDLTDILTLQSAVAQAIAGAIRINLTPQDKARLANTRAVNAQAQEAYLRGRYFHSQGTVANDARAVEYFTRAIALDPSYAPAYAWLSDTYRALGSNASDPPAERFEKAKAAALKAIEIDATLPMAHAALGAVEMNYGWNWSSAENSFKRAIELGSHDARAYEAYGNYLARMGRFEEAFREVARAKLLDPMSISARVNSGMFLLYARRYDQAVEELRRAVEMGPNSRLAHYYLGQGLVRSGMYEEAIGEFQKVLTLAEDPRGTGFAWLGYTYALSGKTAEATRILEDLKALSTRTYVSAYDIARVYVGLGDDGQALDWLERGYEERGWQMINLKVAPPFIGLHSNPRFQDLLRRMGFPQ